MSTLRIVVVGAGSWGSTFASLLAENGHSVTLASRDPEHASAIAATGRNPRYVPRVDLLAYRRARFRTLPFPRRTPWSLPS